MKRITLIAFALACLLLGAACSVMDYKNDELCSAGCQQKGYGTGGLCMTPEMGQGKVSIGGCTDVKGTCAAEGACKCYCAAALN